MVLFLLNNFSLYNIRVSSAKQLWTFDWISFLFLCFSLAHNWLKKLIALRAANCLPFPHLSTATLFLDKGKKKKSREFSLHTWAFVALIKMHIMQKFSWPGSSHYIFFFDRFSSSIFLHFLYFFFLSRAIFQRFVGRPGKWKKFFNLFDDKWTLFLYMFEWLSAGSSI